MTGFRKRKTERRTVAKKNIVDKEKAEKRCSHLPFLCFVELEEDTLIVDFVS